MQSWLANTRSHLEHAARYGLRRTDPVVRVANDRVQPGVAVTDDSVLPA